MTDIEFSSEMTVKLVRHMAGDDMVVQAAQVSGKGENNPGTVPERLIQALIKGKHGSPFEHNAFTFFVEVPIFVVREWQRHRISSFNEMSGRYTQLRPKFYIPAENRPLIMSEGGTAMKPMMEVGDEEQAKDFREHLKLMSIRSWTAYQDYLRDGIVKEVARMALPVNIYTQMYWTVNARSLMNFLSLRSRQDGAAFPSYPQREIQEAAEWVEIFFASTMPFTYKAFVDNGRIAP